MRMPSLVSITQKHQSTSILLALALIAGGLVSLNLSGANASSSVSYDFNTTGDLSNNFNATVSSGTITQSANGGLSDSGAIYTPGAANAVFSSKAGYSLGPVGSTYTFTSFVKSVENSGYSGMGFTTQSPVTTTHNSVYRPDDAIGVSVHGGGFVLHNGATDVNGNWNSGASGVVGVKNSTIGDLLNSGSPDHWYKVVFTIQRDSTSTVDTRLEVWSTDSTGTLLRPSEADAIFEWNDISNPTIQGAPVIYSYINFSGNRVHYFDNYSVSLAGGATVVEAGAPVVVTNSVQQSNGVVTVDGEVTSAGGTSMVERGFVYGASSDPTVSDNKVAVAFGGGDGTGVFQGVSPTLSAGTYYFRTYATNGLLTSYGSETEVIIAASGPQSITNTGFENGLTGWLNSASGVTVVTPPVTQQSGSNSWVYGVHETKAAKLVPAGSQTFNTDLQTNLGLSSQEVTALRASFVGTPTDIVWISKEVTLTSGTTYRMAWNYTSTDYVPFNDGSITTLVPVSAPGSPIVTINNSSTNNRWALLGYTNPGTGMYSTGDYGSTGWQFATYKVSETGTYKLGFATFNIGDTALSPMFLIDDNLGTVTKNGVAFNPVPPNDPTAPSLAQSISPTTQNLSASTGSAITPTSAFTASGLVGTVTYAVSPSLPAGLTLNASTGVISGTPTAKSSATFTITATGSTSGTATATIVFSIKDPQAALVVTSTSGTPGTALTLTTSGGSGTGNVSYTVVDGTATGCAISAGQLTSTTPGTCLVTATKAADSDYSSISSVQTTVTFATPVTNSNIVPPTPTPSPTPTTSPTPRPTPTTAPLLPLPVVSPTPTPTPTPTLGPINLIPQLEPTPGVVFGSTNPIPQILVDLLSKPLAYVLEQLSQSPLLPTLAPSESLAYENGSPVEIQLVKTDTENGYVLRGDGWEVALEATDSSGTPLRLDDSGNIILNNDRFVQFSGTGFAPGSIVKVWLFSEPSEVGEVLADASGNFIGQAQLPEGIPTGEHTVQLNGLTQDGQLRSVSLGVLVEPVVIPTIAPIDFTPLWNIALAAAAVVLIFFLVLLARKRWFLILAKRRKDKEEEQEVSAVWIDEIDRTLASAVAEASPLQQFPVDSRKKLGKGAPPNKRSNFRFRPKNT